VTLTNVNSHLDRLLQIKSSHKKKRIRAIYFSTLWRNIKEIIRKRK